MNRTEGHNVPLSDYQDALTALLRDGYAVLNDRLAADEVAMLQSQLEPWFARTPRCQGDFYGWRTTRVAGLLAKAPIVQSLALDPLVLAIAQTVLAPSCDHVQLNLTQAVRVHPGELAQAPHRDEEMWPAGDKPAPWLINVMWAVSDFTPENGATRLWPGSHTQALDRALPEGECVAGAMRPGSALMFLGALTHGAGANHSRTARTGVIVSYCLGWLKQYENQFLAYPRDVAQTFPEPLQRLIGYQIHRPNLGGWEGRDPIQYLREREGPLAHVDALTPEIEEQLRQLRAGAGER